MDTQWTLLACSQVHIFPASLTRRYPCTFSLYFPFRNPFLSHIPTPSESLDHNMKCARNIWPSPCQRIFMLKPSKEKTLHAVCRYNGGREEGGASTKKRRAVELQPCGLLSCDESPLHSRFHTVALWRRESPKIVLWRQDNPLYCVQKIRNLMIQLRKFQLVVLTLTSSRVFTRYPRREVSRNKTNQTTIQAGKNADQIFPRLALRNNEAYPICKLWDSAHYWMTV